MRWSLRIGEKKVNPLIHRNQSEWRQSQIKDGNRVWYKHDLFQWRKVSITEVNTNHVGAEVHPCAIFDFRWSSFCCNISWFLPLQTFSKLNSCLMMGMILRLEKNFCLSTHRKLFYLRTRSAGSVSNFCGNREKYFILIFALVGEVALKDSAGVMHNSNHI